MRLCVGVNLCRWALGNLFSIIISSNFNPFKSKRKFFLKDSSSFPTGRGSSWSLHKIHKRWPEKWHKRAFRCSRNKRKVHHWCGLELHFQRRRSIVHQGEARNSWNGKKVDELWRSNADVKIFRYFNVSANFKILQNAFLTESLRRFFHEFDVSSNWTQRKDKN